GSGFTRLPTLEYGAGDYPSVHCPGGKRWPAFAERSDGEISSHFPDEPRLSAGHLRQDPEKPSVSDPFPAETTEELNGPGKNFSRAVNVRPLLPCKGIGA